MITCVIELISIVRPYQSNLPEIHTDLFSRIEISAKVTIVLKKFGIHFKMRLVKIDQLFFLVLLCVFFIKGNNVSAYYYAQTVQSKSDYLYEIVSSNILSLKMRLDQTKEKIAKANHDWLRTLTKLHHLLLKLNKKQCEHEYISLDYRYKQAIEIKARSELQAHFTIKLKVDHKTLVDQKQSQMNGHDLRVFYLPKKGSLPVEIDRFISKPNTKNTTVLFRTQKPIPAGSSDRKSYVLVFGGKHNDLAKADPKKIFAFYDNFESRSLDGWKQNWGDWSVKNGKLYGKTGKSSHGNGEVGLYIKEGQQWKDVEVELDFMETGANTVYPGSFLRIMNPSLKQTTAWWFAYYTDHKECTMRPFQSNKDGGWKYRCNLPEKLLKNKWYHFKYRVEGNKIKQWANGKLIQDVAVDKQWMIPRGTVGLGCHSIYSGSPTGCKSYYDNIKVTLLAKVIPKVSTGQICNIVKNVRLGTKENPASSCRQIYEEKVAAGKARQNRIYWIKTSDKGNAVQTFCDMKMGGWTLVGKISGQAGNIYKSWLVKNVNVEVLKYPKLPNKNVKYGCLDSRRLAVKHSSVIMFSSGENALGVGAKWVQWKLSPGREIGTWWNHAVGYKKVKSATARAVKVRAWNGKRKTCYQNKYGIMPFQSHGGSYPYASLNKQGNTGVKDYCMGVGVLRKGSKADGWSNTGPNGYDSPQSNSDWPNGSYNHQKPYLLVWLK